MKHGEMVSLTSYGEHPKAVNYKQARPLLEGSWFSDRQQEIRSNYITLHNTYDISVKK